MRLVGCMEYERVAYDRLLPVERRMAAVKAMHRLERERARLRAQHEVRPMEEKTRIVVDCDHENHAIEMNGETAKCRTLEELAEALEAATLAEAA